MRNWEYKLIDVWRAVGPPVEEFEAELLQAGNEGWEAVGEVTLGVGGRSFPKLLLKRPQP